MDIEVECKECGELVEVSIQWWQGPEPPPILVICPRCRKSGKGRKTDMPVKPRNTP